LAKQLSVFVGLIITNCIVMGRAEAFAMQNPPWPVVPGRHRQRPRLQRVLLTLGVTRELFGAGKLFGVEIIRLPRTAAGTCRTACCCCRPRPSS
jgi:Na+-transporting NADH:ubiquinone oxidoreductase subunit D